MRARIMVMFFTILFFILIDYYFFQGVLVASQNWSPGWKNGVRIGFWIPTALCFLAVMWWTFGNQYYFTATTRSFIITGVVATYFSKILGLIVLFTDDIQRGVRWVVNFFRAGADTTIAGPVIPRSEFLSKLALATTAVPFTAFAYGIISGAHDYRVRKVTVNLKNLPKSFDGLRIGQISDIHSGSFWNKTAVKGGVEMMLQEKPDVIFFTGDLVNNESSEVKEYVPIFDKLRAPLGVYSVTGNHDYGDYKKWDSQALKNQNFKDLMEAHRIMGYDLLMNEHRFLQQGSDKIAIIGNENWGAGRFSKYGKLDQAVQGTDEAAVKILLSHDPTHWDAQVRPNHPDIDLMLSGHTHGFQFGVEIGGVKWSPVQYVYRQWADLYKEGEQYIYVNRGFGYLGYPGRVGMPPELTILELKRA
ncbi:MAG TPA: metallophosphoesterase [Cyclobacteriaceae bacterium]|nr:metallophosphoesterase [Cyclobacteriaceae bacterium]